VIQKRVTSAGEPRYLVRLFRGRDPVTGKKQYAFQTFATKKEAQRWERQQGHALDSGTFVEPSTETLGAYLSGWLAGPARMKVRDQTLEGYRRLLNRYVLTSELAAVPLVRLTTLRLETFYAALSDRPLSPRTVRYVHSLLHAALAKATRDRRLPSNPAAGATLPRQIRREMQVLDREQLARLLATSEATSNRWHALWCVLAHGGLRPSEALRLTWRDVGPKSIVVRGETKNDGSKRTVTLPGSTMEALAWHGTQQEAEKIAAGAAYRDAGLVFAGQTGGPLDLKNAAKRHFKLLLTAYYPLPNIRVYDLRHTHISHALAAGTPVHVVSKRVGHASAKMTLDVYGHVLSGQDGDAVAKLEAYWAAGTT
jgi:integrase